MIYEKKKILITVKAYPNPSRTYGETVCCAGIDLNTYQWIRLFPLQFRDLDYEKKFKKYSIIEVNCAKAINDKRPESYKINPNTLDVIEQLDTKDNWERRKSIVLRLPVKSMCQILKDMKDANISLGLVKPHKVTFEIKKRASANQIAWKKCYAQLSLFIKKKEPVENIPYRFYYSFYCANDKSCLSHQLSIVDWEIFQAFRHWRSQYRDENKVLEEIKKKWIDITSTTKRDVFFYVGNTKRFHHIFMILGVFYPPRKD